MKIKNRKVLMHRILVPMGGRSCKIIYVTAKQLIGLNKIPVGKEVFLSDRYCHISGGFWVIRTIDGLQYMPFPNVTSDHDVSMLEEILNVKK